MVDRGADTGGDAEDVAAERDEVVRTRAAYEVHAESFSEKYRRSSVAATHWDEVGEWLPEPNQDAAPVRILDAGCGPGADAATFAERGYEVVGVDVTRPFLRDAAGYADAAFVAGDVRSLPLSASSVDAVWACASLLHLARTDVPTALAEFRRVLRPGGTLFLTLKYGGETGYDLDGVGRFFAMYEPADVRELLLDTDFDVRDLEVEGTPDDGRWLWAVASR